MKSWFILLLLVVFLQTCPFAQTLTNDQEARIQRLEQIIQQQQDRIDSLQQRLATQPQVGNAAYADEVVRQYSNRPEAQDDERAFGYEAKGFFLRIPNFELYMGGQLQMGLAIFENDTYDNNSFYPHGIVFDFDVYIYKDWHARIEFALDATVENHNAFQNGFNAESPQIWDAYIEYLGITDGTNPTFAIKVGQFHVPFSIAGQWNPVGGTSIWAEPFINGWAHGRDPGLMLWGVLSDMIQYQLSLHNGEGQSTTNASDDFLMAGALRLFPFGYSENPNSFIHLGMIRSRDDDVHDFGHPAAATLRTPWGRPVYDPNAGGFSETQGWRTGLDFGFSIMHDLDETNFIYVESEIMWVRWERDFDTGRMPFLEGFGFHFGFQFRHNLTPDVPGAGIFPLFKISYSDIDEKGDSGSTPGQDMWVYTIGLGYAFNAHFNVQFNWVIADLEMNSSQGIPVTATRNDRPDGTDDSEHAWFLQFTAMW